MQGLGKFESAVLAKLLAGDHPLLTPLRSQTERACVVSREYSDAGFSCTVVTPPDAPMVKEHLDFQFGDANAKMSGLKHGAGFVMFVRAGRLDTLEGYSYDEPWPAALDDFELSYQSEPRNPRLPCG